MAPHFQAIALFTHVVGVVNHPDGQPQNLLLERLQAGKPSHGLGTRGGDRKNRDSVHMASDWAQPGRMLPESSRGVFPGVDAPLSTQGADQRCVRVPSAVPIREGWFL